MEFATGAMSSLLPKLGELLLQEYDLQKGLKKGIKNLRDELLIIEAALVKLSNVPLDQLDPLAKIWANDVREISYAIEDSLDSFMVRVEGLEPDKPHPFLGFIKMTCKKVKKLKIRREIANDIKDVKIQVQEVKERYDRYKDIIGNSSAATKVDPRLLALHSKVSNLVGIGEAIDELTKRLSQSNVVSKEYLKIISIVGFGGLGKTTLAKAIYDNLSKKFDCGSFVSVGRNPDEKKVLRDILYELDKKKFINITESKKDERQLIEQLQEFLVDKRYLIVIDDICDLSTWELIKCALVDSNSGSRIITTTRIHEVARNIGGVYNMKPLSDDNSEKLFHSRISGGEGKSANDHSDELSNRILRKCGGVPLSIITLASLLVSKPREDWPKVFDSIGFGHEDNETVQNTRKIVSFGYYDLPFHLKTCLLHLSVYPEDYWINKNRVIWEWVAEGFVPSNQGIVSFELGQSYYNDLLNRSMIQSADLADLGMDRQEGCRVHDIVLDLIRTLSNELNFVTTQDKLQYDTCSASTRRCARRLAIHDGTVDHMDIGHVRSFYAIQSVNSVVPSLLSFNVLRVLVLDNPAGGFSLENLGKLVQLRYLGLMQTPHIDLPTDIGHDLKFLQTLNVCGTGIQEIPSSVGELTRLMCLCVSEGTRMMARIGKLTSLEELELHHVDKSPDFVTDLGKLGQLRVLKIHFDEIDLRMHKALVKSLCSHRKIQSLAIMSESKGLVEADGWEEWEISSDLRQFSMDGMILPRRPSWVDSSCVPHLSYLSLLVYVLEAGDLQILGRLSSLRFFKVVCFSNLSYTVGSHEFQNLTYLCNNTEIVCGEGALPMLEELVCFARAGKDVGLVGNMPLLQRVSYSLNCAGLSRKEVETAEAALRLEAETHTNRPYIEIRRCNYECAEEEHKSTVISSVDEELQGDNAKDRSAEEESHRMAAVSWYMLVELGRTVVVCSEDLQDYLSSMFSSVLNHPVIHDLLLKLGSQFGLEYPLGYWWILTNVWEERDTKDVLNEAVKSDRSVNNLSEMMQQMMPVVSQVLAGFPSLEYSLHPEQNDDGILAGELDRSLQENDGVDKIVAKNDEAGPSRLP